MRSVFFVPLHGISVNPGLYGMFGFSVSSTSISYGDGLCASRHFVVVMGEAWDSCFDPDDNQGIVLLFLEAIVAPNQAQYCVSQKKGIDVSLDVGTSFRQMS